MSGGGGGDEWEGENQKISSSSSTRHVCASDRCGGQGGRMGVGRNAAQRAARRGRACNTRIAEIHTGGPPPPHPECFVFPLSPSPTRSHCEGVDHRKNQKDRCLGTFFFAPPDLPPLHSKRLSRLRHDISSRGGEGGKNGGRASAPPPSPPHARQT